jgi:putative heme-binding domain-containing protein
MRYLPLLLVLTLPLCAQQNSRRSSSAAGGEPGAQFMHNSSAIAQGKTLFLTVCSGCHGPNGEGGRGPSLIEARNIRRASNTDLFGWIQKGIPGTDMPPAPLPDENLWQLTAFVRNLSAPAYEQPLPGNPQAGSEVYFAKGGCVKCHMIRGQGGLLGPDLSNAGATLKQVQLREAIVAPNKRITEGFTPVVVKLKDGKTIQGVAKNFDNYSMQLLANDGALHLLPKAQLESVVYRAESWMPGDFGTRLSATELDDLVAFLSRQAIRAPASEQENASETPRGEHDNN